MEVHDEFPYTSSDLLNVPDSPGVDWNPVLQLVGQSTPVYDENVVFLTSVLGTLEVGWKMEIRTLHNYQLRTIYILIKVLYHFSHFVEMSR